VLGGPYAGHCEGGNGKAQLITAFVCVFENLIGLCVDDGENDASERIPEWRSVNSQQICPYLGDGPDIVPAKPK
jgi:hypothetical protein